MHIAISGQHATRPAVRLRRLGLLGIAVLASVGGSATATSGVEAVDPERELVADSEPMSACDESGHGLCGLVHRLATLHTFGLDDAVEHGMVRDVTIERVAEADGVRADGPGGRILALAVVRREPRSVEELLTLLLTGTATPDPTLGRVGDRRVATADIAAAATGAATALEVSLDAAWIAANRLAGIEIDFDRYVAVTSATEDSVLEPGDRVLLLDAEPVGLGGLLSAADGEPSSSVFTVIRDDRQMRIAASDVDLDQISVLEAARTETVRPAMVVRTGTSGPSAGIMSSLAYFDYLTPTDLTNGSIIAGTGTVTPHGYVGAVEGVDGKAQAAVDAGADVLFVHPDNAAEAEQVVDGRLPVVPVASIRDAVQWLREAGLDRAQSVTAGSLPDVGPLIEPSIASS